MSVGSKSLPARRAGEGEGGGENGDSGRAMSRQGGKKVAAASRYGRSFSEMELSIGPGPLRDVDSGRLKDKIRKWAKAVVAFARQLSFGSPRSRSRSRDATTARSATFPSKSGLGADEKDPPT